MNSGENVVILIERAEPVGDYRIRLSFNDGAQRVVDFAPFLRGSRNPLIQAYLDPGKFSGFRVENGDLLWGDYDLCFPVADLYDGAL